MTKQDCVNRMISMGYRAALESGVVMIEVESEAERSRVKKAVKDIGYTESWGTRGKRDERNGNNV